MSTTDLLDKILLYTPFIVSFILFIITLIMPLQITKSRKWLVFTMLGVVVSFVSPFLHYIFNAGIQLYFDVFFFPVILTTAVFRYFYVRSTVQNFNFSRREFHHFVPILVFGIVLLFLFSMLSDAQLIFYKTNRMKQKLLLSMPEYQLTAVVHIIIFRVIFVAQAIFYIVKIYQLAIQQKKKINNLPQTSKTIDYTWIHKVNIVTVIVKIVTISLLIATYEKLEVRIGFNVFMTILTIYFALVCMFQKITFGRKVTELQLNNDQRQENQVEIWAEGDESEKSENLKQRITVYFEEEKPYLNPDMKIDDLCIIFNTNRSYISKTINSEYGMNFYNFINKYRIERAKEIISDKNYANYSIKSIAEMSGFKSNSSFYAFFKQIVGVTPTDFRKEI